MFDEMNSCDCTYGSLDLHLFNWGKGGGGGAEVAHQSTELDRKLDLRDFLKGMNLNEKVEQTHISISV